MVKALAARHRAPVLVALTIGFIILQSVAGRPALKWLEAAVSPSIMPILLIGVPVVVVAIAFRISASKLIFLVLTIGFLFVGLLVWTDVLYAVEVMHILSFGALGVVAARLGVRLALVVLVVTAIGDEVLQYFLPSRVADLRDVVINLSSGVFGLGFVRCFAVLATGSSKTQGPGDSE